MKEGHERRTGKELYPIILVCLDQCIMSLCFLTQCKRSIISVNLSIVDFHAVGLMSYFEIGIQTRIGYLKSNKLKLATKRCVLLKVSYCTVKVQVISWYLLSDIVNLPWALIWKYPSYKIIIVSKLSCDH